MTLCSGVTPPSLDAKLQPLPAWQPLKAPPRYDVPVASRACVEPTA